MYKWCYKLSVTIVVLQFCDILGAPLGNNLTKLVCRLTSALHHFISFIRSFTGVKIWVKNKIAPCNSVAPFPWEPLCSLHYYVQTLLGYSGGFHCAESTCFEACLVWSWLQQNPIHVLLSQGISQSKYYVLLILPQKRILCTWSPDCTSRWNQLCFWDFTVLN